MPAPHPRMHGLTHVQGGPDPIPLGTVPGGDYPTVVKSITGLRGYWRLGESAAPFLDTSGYSDTLPADLTRHVNGVAMTLDVAGALPAGSDDGAVTQNYAGTNTSGNTAADWLEDNGNAGDHRFSFDANDEMSVAVWVNPSASGNTWDGGIVTALGMGVAGSPNYDSGWALYMAWPAQEIVFSRSGPGPTTQTCLAGALPAGTWTHVAATYDGESIRVYVNGVLAAGALSDVPMSTTGLVGVGQMTPNHGLPGHGDAYRGRFYGSLDEVAVWAGTLTPEQVAALAGATGTGFADPGDIAVSDGHGGVTWQPPTVEVEHGDLTLDDTPVESDGSGYAGGPVSASGWLTEPHVETVVLYDSNPARFTVPTRDWTRVPFDKIGIWRTWQPDAGETQMRTRWLPDDRGLTAQAKNGILHINDDMGQDDCPVHAWFSIEWPVVDYTQLPNEAGTGDDAYVRAGRIKDLSHGFVLRAAPGDTLRRFFEWQIPNPHDAIPDWVDYDSDNPYPIYPIWAPRPMHLPDPYPKMTEEQSHLFYAPRKVFLMDADLPAGVNLCLEVWQDSPWTLRFSTDTFEEGAFPPNVAYQRRPYLQVGLAYDPETIDHTTGKVL